MTASAAAPRPAPPLTAHDHVWTLSAVDFTDGQAVEELGCDCGAVWFR